MASSDLDQFHLFTGQAARVIEPAPYVATTLQGQSPRLSLAVLGSGSGGNCSALAYGDRLLLIDAGFGPRATARRLKAIGASITQVAGVCLTHLDCDHLRTTWFSELSARRIPLYVHERHMDRLWTLPDEDDDLADLDEQGLLHFFTRRPFSPLEGLTLHTLRLAHDAQGTCAFRIESAQGVVGYATDLGHVPDELVAHFTGVDLLAIESNYDVAMQVGSPRPYHLKQRIMGGHGHLSNEQCFEAVRRIHAACLDCGHAGLASVVLLHRSQQCNCPHIIRRLYASTPHLHDRLNLSEQGTPLPWLAVRPGDGGDGDGQPSADLA